MAAACNDFVQKNVSDFPNIVKNQGRSVSFVRVLIFWKKNNYS